MATAISSPDELAGLIQPDKLAAAGFVPPPKRVSVIAGTDHEGNDAYHVFLVFPDETAPDQLAWRNVKPLVQWVRDRIRKANGEQQWPYVRVKREADLLTELS